MACLIAVNTCVKVRLWPRMLRSTCLEPFKSSFEVRHASMRCNSRWPRFCHRITVRQAGSIFCRIIRNKSASSRQSISHNKTLLSFLSPFAFIKKRLEEPDHELEVLSHIPREVFKKEDIRKARPRRNFVFEMTYFFYSKLRLCLRVFRLAWTFLPVVFCYPLTYCSEGFTRFWWHWLLQAFQCSGPTYIKLGQWASTRRDLFSADFCDLFSTLQRRVKGHSWYTTRGQLRKAFGNSWTQIFVAVDRKPIGSGCIAQVHKAYMRPDMIPSETVIEEAHEDSDDEDIDFSDGLEILGFGHFVDTTEDISEHMEYEWSKRWWRQSGVPPPSVAPPADNTYDGLKNNEPKLDAGVSEPQSTEKSSDSNHPPDAEEQQLVPVAIKVLHPGVYHTVCRDLAILQAVASFVEFVFPSLRWLSLPGCVQEFSELLIRQIDLRYEARSLETFVENFADNPNIRFPRPVRPYCKRNVLVETYEEGEPISNYVADKEAQPEGLQELLAGYGLDALLQMIFVDNFIHGDLHPGNILVQNSKHYVPTEENKLVLVDVCDTVVVNVRPAETPVRLVMLDVGISTSLNEQDRENFKNVFSAVVIGDGEQVAQLLLDHSQHDECKDVAAFRRDMGNIVMEARRQTIKLGKTEVGKLLGQVFTAFRKHKVKMDSHFSCVILAIFVLEGLGRSLDPEVDILEKAKPVLLS